MNNQYLFFKKQEFESCNLEEYVMRDMPIPKTQLHIYEFKCKESAQVANDVERAKLLDALTQILNEKYPNEFQIINCESSQFFCAQLYPLVVDFETSLRQAIYISRALYENGNVEKDSFLIEVGKEKKTIESMDFGKIYEAIFTDESLQQRIRKLNERKLTKADFISKLQSEEEISMWQKWVGTDYSYIGQNFLLIEDYRNDVMHSHLISYDKYIDAKRLFENAKAELLKAVQDKLLPNESSYLNAINIIEAIQMMANAAQAATEGFDVIKQSETLKHFYDALSKLAIPLDSSDDNDTEKVTDLHGDANSVQEDTTDV